MEFKESGILVVNKPVDMTSARVVAIIKRLTGVKKIGHTGTLDPFATGILICCINKATKVARFLLKEDKKYRAVLHLGVETDTQDATGEIIRRFDSPIEYSHDAIREALALFEGEIMQLPPVFSALKHNGVPLYKLARQGKPVQKEARKITISNIQIKEINLPDIEFEVSCSSGTYIRTLGSDIGNELGSGGHIKELERTENSGFTRKDAISVSELEDKLAASEERACDWLSNRMISMTDALKNIPGYIADNDLISKVKYGKIVYKKDIENSVSIPCPGNLKILDSENHLIAILDVKKDDEKLDYCCVLI